MRAERAVCEFKRRVAYQLRPSRALVCPSWLCDFDRTSGPAADVMSLSCLVLLKSGGVGVGPWDVWASSL